MSRRVMAAIAAMGVALAGCSSSSGNGKDPKASASASTEQKASLPDRSNSRAKAVTVQSKVDQWGTVAYVQGGSSIEPGRYTLKVEGLGPEVRSLQLSVIRPRVSNLQPRNYRYQVVDRREVEAMGGVAYALDVRKGDLIEVTDKGATTYSLTFEPLATKAKQTIPHSGEWVAGLDFAPGVYELSSETDTTYPSVYNAKGELVVSGTTLPFGKKTVKVEFSKGDTLVYSARSTDFSPAGGVYKLTPAKKADGQTWDVAGSQGKGAEASVQVKREYVVGKDIQPGYYRVDAAAGTTLTSATFGLVAPGGETFFQLGKKNLDGSADAKDIATIHAVDGQVLSFQATGTAKSYSERDSDQILTLVPIDKPKLHLAKIPTGMYVVGVDVPAGRYDVGAEDKVGRSLRVLESGKLVAVFAPELVRFARTTAQVELKKGQILAVAEGSGFALRKK